MTLPRLLFICSLIMLSGCSWPVRQQTDRVLHEMASHPFDSMPPEKLLEEKAKPEETPAAPKTPPSQTNAPVPETDIQTTAYMQAEPEPESKERRIRAKYDLKIPSAIPGSEAPPIDFKNMTPEQKQKVIKQLYGELPPLPEAPTPLPGPDGRPYTLSDLQKLAAENSPTLREAVANLKSAEGALVQAKTYQNPTIGYSASPTNNNSNAGAQGAFVDQHITMWGKRPLAVAASQKSLDNAQLALRRARSDLSTNVRNAYFALIVAKETVRVNEALARFTDEIYRLYTGYLAATIAAPYEPAALRSQAYSIRLAYKQAITSYDFAWIQLVATIGLPQLPLTEVAGRVDRLIPYYDYDKVLAHILARHTDALTARNGVQIAQYNLKLAQITPYPDMDWYGAVWKESTIVPYVIFYQVQVGFPIPIWDQNKGNIISAQGALIAAVEESHRVENALTNTLAGNFTNYQNNLNALEYYRRYILPDQVRYYRGVFDRRQLDINASPNDLVTAQQALATNVQAYLGILGSLWTSVVSVADLMQTDDLFQLAKKSELPELPDLDNMPSWLCPHHRSGKGAMNGCPPKAMSLPSVSSGQPVQTAPTADAPALPAPRPVDAPASGGQRREPPPEIPKSPGTSGTEGESSSEGEPSP